MDNLRGRQFGGCPLDKEKFWLQDWKQLPVYPFDIDVNVKKICINNKIFVTVT